MMVMVALLATQCKKSAEPLANEPAGETMEVTVRVENSTAKTDITDAGVVSWKKGDKLYVVGATQGLLGYVSALADGKSVSFEGTIIPVNAVQTLNFYYVGDKDFTLDGSGNYTFDLSSQDGTLAGIAAHSQLMFGMSGEIAAGTTDFGTIAMTSLMAIAHLNITNNTSNTVTVTGGFATSTFNAMTYDGTTAITGTEGTITMTSSSPITECYIALLPGKQTLSFTYNNAMYSGSLDEKDVVANEFYNSENPIEVECKPNIPEGALSDKKFTVGEGKQVYFSKGNLYWNGSSFEIEPDQYNYTNTWDANYVTHFYWSSDAAKAYGKSNSSMTGTGSDVFFTNNKEVFVANNESGWYSLSQSEWEYLLLTRPDASKLKSYYLYSAITIESKSYKGIFIYPDGYNGNAVGGEGVATWAAINEAGIVFLPYAGRRYGNGTINFSDTFEYWSSTPDGTQNAYYLYMNQTTPVVSSQRYYGSPVRLVYSAN